MNTTKFSEWLQIAAAAGVIIGLILVAYELRLSNRIAWEQASADGLERWDQVYEFWLVPGMPELFLRAHEGDDLTREEALKLMAFTDVALNTLLHEYRLYLTGTLELPQGWDTAYSRVVRFYVGSEYGLRRWEVTKVGWQPDFVSSVDKILAESTTRDVMREIDYMSGVSSVIN